MFKKISAVVIASLVLAGGAYAYAAEDPSTPSGESSTAATRQHRPRRHHPMRRAIHGELIVRTQDGFEKVTFDRGKVTAVSATSITIERADDQSVTKAINGDTRFKGVDSAEQIEPGKGALVVSKGDTAVLIAQRDGDAPPSPDAQ
jgi:hypothetical protein